MDIILIELFLWIGLIFFFWALKDGLGHVETDIEDLGLLQTRMTGETSATRGYDKPDRLLDAIGTYQDAPIYRVAIIGGQPYQFDHILTRQGEKWASGGQRLVAPGLVYIPVTERSRDMS